jgi:hypothetical protein
MNGSGLWGRLLPLCALANGRFQGEAGQCVGQRAPWWTNTGAFCRTYQPGARYACFDRCDGLEEAQTAPTLKFQSSYNATVRLDPGQNMTQPVEGDFPAAARKAKKLKEIRIELAYVPSSYQLQTASFSVSIGGQ